MYWNFVADSWRNREKDLYGRMDFSYDGHGERQSCLNTTAIRRQRSMNPPYFQWTWLEQAIERKESVPRNCDQFSELHEGFCSRPFSRSDIEGCLHLACNRRDRRRQREQRNISRIVPEKLVWKHACSGIEEIGVDALRDGLPILTIESSTPLFKLYPWEWMMEEEFGCHLPASRVHFIEPPWKAMSVQQRHSASAVGDVRRTP